MSILEFQAINTSININGSSIIIVKFMTPPLFLAESIRVISVILAASVINVLKKSRSIVGNKIVWEKKKMMVLFLCCSYIHGFVVNFNVMFLCCSYIHFCVVTNLSCTLMCLIHIHKHCCLKEIFYIFFEIEFFLLVNLWRMKYMNKIYILISERYQVSSRKRKRK